jgi:magnesium-protoporphyrin O-methyltransferase
VREGRDRCARRCWHRLPADLTGARVLDAGCGRADDAIELALRGAEVVAVDISPSLVEIAEARLPQDLRAQVTFSRATCSPRAGPRSTT